MVVERKVGNELARWHGSGLSREKWAMSELVYVHQKEFSCPLQRQVDV
jgi:hypothetical protein